MAAVGTSSQSPEDKDSRSPPTHAEASVSGTDSGNASSFSSAASPGSRTSGPLEGYTQSIAAQLPVDEQDGLDMDDVGEFDCFDQPDSFL